MILKNLFGAGLVSAALALGLAGPAAAQQSGAPRTVVAANQTLTITAFKDGARRDKYVVMAPGSRNVWYAQGGSANGGAGETGRRTSNQEWCRVRYLYGDNVRVPECYGGFMYSSHLITGIDGTHYELWFSPDSLSYFKIRNQETGIWFAHDGSANDGRVRTSKDDWCRVIYYQMTGIVKSPDECKDFNTKTANAIAGNSGSGAQSQELEFLRSQLGSFQSPKKLGFGLAGGGLEAAAEAGMIRGLSGASSQAFKNATREGTRGLSQVGSGMASKAAGTAANIGANAAAGAGVGLVVDYGVERFKTATGLTAKDANAGWIAAEVVTTTVVSSSITTAILVAAGASFNPVTAGIGLLIAGGFAAGEEIVKASNDTGIKFEDGFTAHPRYSRDINTISEALFERKNPPTTFTWEKCADEGKACNFTGIRSVRFGKGDDATQFAFADGVMCNSVAAGKGKDPKEGVVKECHVQRYNFDSSHYFIKANNHSNIYMQMGDASHCVVPNMEQMNAWGGMGMVRLTNNPKPALGSYAGACSYPNGFYKHPSSTNIYFLSGPPQDSSVELLSKLGTRICIVPNMQTLNDMGGGGKFATVADGQDLRGKRLDQGVCTNGSWNVVAGAAGRDIGDNWAITTTVVGADFQIVRLNAAENGWDVMPGAASRIGGTKEAPWVATKSGDVYLWDKVGWKHIPSTLRATDVGDGWMISNEATNGGFKIYRYNLATNVWDNVPGGATRVGGTYDDPWVVASNGAIFQYVNNAWVQRLGSATDVGAGSVVNSGGVFRWNEGAGRFDILSAAPQVAIGGSKGFEAVLSSTGNQFVIRR